MSQYLPRWPGAHVTVWALASLGLVGIYIADEWLQPRLLRFADRPRTGAPPPAVTALMDAVRTTGKWPALVFAGVLLTVLAPPRGVRWAAVLAVSVVAAILIGELLWRSVSRLRPNHPDSGGRTVFLEAFHGFSGSRQAPSFPSSEAAASMAAAVVLARALPAGAILWYGLAGGCALLRVEAGAHFPSDVWAGAMLGAAVALAVTAVARRRGWCPPL